MVMAAALVLLTTLAGCSNTKPPGNQPAALSATRAAQLTAPPTTPLPAATPSDTSAAPGTAGQSFTWADPNGYRFKVTVSFGTPGIADPVAGCAGSDAPPDTTNIPFTLTVENLLPDRGSSLPMLSQALTGLTANPHPAGASSAIILSDGGNCGDDLYGLAGRQQNANAVPAGSTVTLQGVVYAVPTPVAGAMTFTSLFDSSTAVATVSLPTGS